MQLTIALQSAVNSALLTKRKASIQSARQSGATKLRFTSDRASCACLSNKAFNSAQPQAWPSRSELPPDQLPTGFVRFQASDLRSEVQIFGLCHLTAELEPAEWIWEHRPSAVLFETAINPDHGAATGSVLTMASTQQAASDFRLRMLMQIAGQLSDATSKPSSASKIWQTVKQQFPGEQLAYIAALAVDASLIFGDRCKTVTYQRLQNIPSISDLDAAFARLSWQNYQELLVVHRPHSQSQQQPQHEDERGPPNYLDCVSTILTHERDVVLANSILRAAEQVGPSGCVAAVIGEAHLPGVTQQLQSGRLSSGEAQEDVLCGTAPDEGPEQQGVRRALLTSCLALCCPAEVVDDCCAVLGPLSPSASEAEQHATEIYGSTRMLLAVLSREELQRVCSGWRCDMYRILEPVRAVRPVNGGSGVDEDVLWDHVRDLSLLIT